MELVLQKKVIDADNLFKEEPEWRRKLWSSPVNVGLEKGTTPFLYLLHVLSINPEDEWLQEKVKEVDGCFKEDPEKRRELWVKLANDGTAYARTPLFLLSP